MESFCGSAFWDLELTWYTDSPDLTTCFQKTILAWVPCGILWLLTPLQIYLFMQSKRRKIPWTGLNIMEIVLCTLLVLLSIVDMIYGTIQYTYSNSYYPVDYYTPFIKCLSFLLADILIFTRRKKGLNTSGVLFIFWLLMSVGGILSYNSVIQHTFSEGNPQYLDEYSYVTTVIYFALLISLLFLSCFSDHGFPLHSKYEQVQEECPLNSASFISQITFWWFNKMAILGHKRSLVKSDMWSLDENDTMKNMIEHFDKFWLPIQLQINKFSRKLSIPTVNKNKADGKNFDDSNKIQVNVMFPLLKTFSGQLFYSGLMKLVSSLMAFVNPVLLEIVLNYVSSDEPIWKGLLYAFLMFFSAMMESFFNSQYEFHAYVVAMKIKSCSISVIYRKSLVLSSSAKTDFTVGEIVNLMSVDTQRIMEFIQIAHLIWAAPLQVAVAMYLLWQQIGISSLGALLVILIIFPFNGFITARLKILQVQMMKQKDNRIKLMNEILGGMKVLKLYAWEESFKQQITNIRNEEVMKLKKQAYLSSCLTFVFFMLPYLMSMTSFAIFVLTNSDNILTPSRAFVSLSLFNLVRVPLGILPMLITYGAMAWVSIRRINKVLGSNELDPNAVNHSDNEDDPVVARHASFSWTKGCNLALHDLDFSIQEGSLVAVVGQVGSGKSSLLSALLGDMEKSHGYVNVKGSVAYVPQQAWMQNATLRNNILFNKPYDEQKYERVIESCALKPDLDVLPGGDQIEIGEKGINLSGGQKQRISLARAVYNNARIYFLDDPLSAVDSHVGKHIFDNVIGPKGLLKKKTRILVTHRITVLPYVDKILVLKNGTITESGSYAELLNKKGAFADFLLQFLSEEVDEPDAITAEDMSIVEEIVSKVGVTPEIERQISKLESEHEDETIDELEKLKRYFSQMSMSEGGRRRMSKSMDKMQDVKKQVGVKLTEAEFAEVGAVKWAVYLEYLKAIGYIGGITTIIAYAACNAFSIGYSLWLSDWSNDGLDINKLYDTALRDLRLGVYGALGIGEIIFVFIATTALNLSCLRGSRLLHDQMLYHVMHAPMFFFDTTPLGRILNRFSKDIDTTDITISFNLRMVIIQGFRTLATFIIISLETPFFLVAVIPIGALYYLIQRFYISTSRQLKRLESITRSPIYTHFSETVTGTTSIRAYGVSQKFNEESNNRVDVNNSCYFPSIAASRWLSIRLEFLGYCIVLLTALFAVLSRGMISPGIVGLSISYALSVTGTLNMLVRSTSDFETNIVSVERCVEYSHLPTEAAWRIESTKPTEVWPTAGYVQFENYSTRYREGLSLVLKNITCTINSGEKVGIVGRTGAGKSSLTLSLFRLIEASGGAIVIDGINIATLGLHDLRSKLTIIPQDPMLFTGPLRMNLDPFDQYSDKDIWRSLEHSHLKTFVSSLQAGLNHSIAEGGENLSVGQRQLVCLARALLRKTKILILDEATAAVDLETDELIQSTIRKEFEDCTILTIAHRLNTIMDYDRIIVLDKGEVIEFDSPSALLGNENSVFCSMAKDAGLV